MKQLQILISYPTDQESSVKTVKAAVREAAEAHTHQGIQIKVLDWRSNITTGVGKRPQDVINEQTSEIDGIIAIIGHRLGAPTGDFKSGVDEEISIARDRFGIANGRVHVLFNSSSSDIHGIDPHELAKVREFQEELTTKGILYSKFTGSTKLKTRVRQAVSRIIYETKVGPESASDDTAAPDDETKIREQIQSIREMGPTKDSPIGQALLTVFESTIPVIRRIGADALDELISESDPERLAKSMIDADIAVSEAIMELKANLDFLYGRIVQGASRVATTHSHTLEIAQFFLFALIQLADQASKLVAADLRHRAEEVLEIETPDHATEYAKNRLSVSMCELAEIIETTSGEVMTLITQLGWQVQMPVAEALINSLPDAQQE